MLLSVCAVCLLAIALSPGLARASGAGAVSFTQTFHDATLSMPVAPLPCAPAGILTLTYNGVTHLTVLTSGVGAGTGWFTFTATGTFVLVTETPGLTFTGRLTMWDGFNGNLNNNVGTGTFTVHATGSDGSTVTFHDVFHMTVLTTTSPPTVVVSFDMPRCG